MNILKLKQSQHLISFLVIILILIIIYIKRCLSYWKIRNVTTPPFIKTSINFLPLLRKRNIGDDITDIYYKMKKAGHHYCGFYLVLKPCFIPINTELIKLILIKDFPYFTNRNFYYNEKDDPLSGHLLSLNDERWRRMRTKLTPTFTSSKMKLMFKFFIDCGEKLEKNLNCFYAKNKTFEMKEEISIYLSDIIITCAFGLDLNTLGDSYYEFQRRANNMLKFNGIRWFLFLIGTLYPNLSRFLGITQLPKDETKFFMSMVKNIVHYRETSNTTRNDFLQLLINIKNNTTIDENEKSPGLKIEELAAQCFIFYLAGYETSATTISFAIYELTQNPQICEKARQEIKEIRAKYNGEITYDGIMEMKYLGQIIEETLRKYPPAYYVTRVCTKDYQLPDSNLIIEKGQQIYIPIGAIHKDPDFYPNPEIFDPDRFTEENKKLRLPCTYLPFGEGPRNCIGMRFGLLETKVALAIMLTNYRFKINPKTKIPFKMHPKSLLLHPKSGIWVDLEK